MDEADEARVIFQYPPVSSHASYTVCQFRNAFFCNFMVISQVMITAGDRARLEPGIYLNDNLVDFHFKYMLREHSFVPEREGLDEPEALLAERETSLHVFSSHFYKKLTEEMPGRMPSAAEDHRRVERWTKHIDLFSKRYLNFIFTTRYSKTFLSLQLGI